MNRRDILLLTPGLLLGVLNAKNLLALDKLNKADQTKFTEILNKFSKIDYKKLSIGKLISEIGLSFLNTPYVGGTLEGRPQEECIINLEGLDCVTFYENCLGFARAIKKGKFKIEDVYNEVTFTRYRDGKLNGYTSRLHYTSDWIKDNEQKNVIHDFTKEAGGVKFDLNVSFLSNYLKEEKYKSILKEQEKKINSLKHFYFPKDQITKIESKLNDGDYIAIATNKAGLDYAHVGMIHKKNGESRFLHASLKQKKVVLDSTISEYVNSVKSHIGITVARPLEIS